MKKIIKIVASIILVSTSIIPQTQISLSLSNNLGTIGDRFRVKILVKTSKKIDNIKFIFNKKESEIISESDPRKSKEGDTTLIEKNFFISFFKTGNFEVGPVKAELIKGNTVIETRESNSVPVKIKSTITDKDKDILPPKDPVEINGNPLFILKYLLFLLLVILLIYLIYRYYKNGKTSPIPNKSTEPPLNEFEKNISRLWGSKPDDKKSYKKFFLKLSSIYKLFLSRYYDFNAEDMTSFEISDSLINREDSPEINQRFEDIFFISDMVKFAKHIPSGNEMDRLKESIDFVIAELKKKEELKKSEEEKKNVPSG